MKLAFTFAALLLCVRGASATTFDYSYRFNGGQRITGTLQGDMVGDYVQNVSDIQVFYNGTRIDRAFHAYGMDDEHGYSLGYPALLSMNAALNKFVFLDVLWVPGSPGDIHFIHSDAEFAFSGVPGPITSDTSNFARFAMGQTGQIIPDILASDRPVNGSFRLCVQGQCAPAGEVPEPGTGLLLAGAVLGLYAARRRRA